MYSFKFRVFFLKRSVCILLDHYWYVTINESIKLVPLPFSIVFYRVFWITIDKMKNITETGSLYIMCSNFMSKLRKLFFIFEFVNKILFHKANKFENCFWKCSTLYLWHFIAILSTSFVILFFLPLIYIASND